MKLLHTMQSHFHLEYSFHKSVAERTNHIYNNKPFKGMKVNSSKLTVQKIEM